MNCLVTGGSGYLGSSLIKYILPKVTSVTNFDIIESSEHFKDVKFVKGDILNFDNIKDSTKNIDIIYHNIAKVPITKNKNQFTKVNEIGTRNLLKAAQLNNVKKIVYISSSAVFGIPTKVPVYENDKRNPIEAYGQSKKNAEDICFDYIKQGLDVSIIRPRTILGENRLGIFSILFEWVSMSKNIPILSNGENIYQFIHIDDLNDAIYKSSLLAGSDIFNIGAEEFGTMRNTIESLIIHTGSKSIIKNIDNNFFLKAAYFLSKVNLIPLQEYHFKVYGKSVYFDINKAKSTLNWTPKFSNTSSIIASYDNYLLTKKNLKKNNHSPHNSILKKGLLEYAHYFF
jgi:nucleoside-diphosphate-sugar epimerase